MNNDKNPTGLEKIVMIVIVLGPVLNIYASPLSMSLEGFLSFLLSIVYFAVFLYKGSQNQKGKKIFWSVLGFYFLYRGINQLMYGIIPLSIIEQFLGYFMAFGCFHRNYYIKCMKVFAVIAIAFFFVQYFEYLRTGTRISGLFNFLPLNYGYDLHSVQEHVMTMGRSSSFFSEPSHFAQFLIPLLAIELFFDNKKFHLLFAALIFVVIVIMQSGTGYVGLIPIALFVFPYYRKNFKSKGQRFFVLLIIIAFVSVTVYSVINNEIGDYIGRRSEELESDTGAGSGFLRIWRGYFVFADYNLLEKIFGVSSSEVLLSHVRNSGFYYGIRAELYFNTVQDILLYTGIIGFVIFVLVIRKIWLGNTICGKALLCCLIAISLVEQCYFSNVMLVHLLLAESMKYRSPYELDAKQL